MAQPVPGGNSKISQKDHLLAVYKALGQVPPDLAKWLNKPQELMYLWTWLLQLQHPLSFVEVKAWQELTGRATSRWEVEALVRLDRVRSHD